jgi:hypothetical protein
VLWLLLPAPGLLAAEPSSRPLPIAGPGLSPSEGEWAPSLWPCDDFQLVLSWERSAGCLRLTLGPDILAARSTEDAPPVDLAAERKPDWLLASLVSVGAVGGSAANSFTDGSHRSFHVTHEGFFGRDTYAGGADKASHFVSYYIVSKEFANLYAVLGYSERQSIWMGFGVASLAGLVTELGDGTTKFGFSYQDLLMDTLGAGSAALIAHFRADDLVGFRRGFLLPPSGDATCCQVVGTGRDYSNEIYTADLKLAGLARRLGWDIGPLRWLQLSLTYGTKSYPSGLPELRERQVGLEIGLNPQQILDDLGVRRNVWWGYLLHVALDNIRIPFTAVGVRYDLNHGRWRGPDNGHSYLTR